jgi:hypothetical protein
MQVCALLDLVSGSSLSSAACGPYRVRISGSSRLS